MSKAVPHMIIGHPSHTDLSSIPPMRSFQKDFNCSAYKGVYPLYGQSFQWDVIRNYHFGMKM